MMVKVAQALRNYALPTPWAFMFVKAGNPLLFS